MTNKMAALDNGIYYCKWIYRNACVVINILVYFIQRCW